MEGENLVNRHEIENDKQEFPSIECGLRMLAKVIANIHFTSTVKRESNIRRNDENEAIEKDRGQGDSLRLSQE